jgi:hypothetical protein
MRLRVKVENEVEAEYSPQISQIYTDFSMIIYQIDD